MRPARLYQVRRAIGERVYRGKALNQTLRTVREYATRIEAETVRIRLGDAGIDSLITGTDMATALGFGGAMTARPIRLEVAEDDLDRARALLDADDRLVATAGPWICGRCHEQNEAAFEICWSCSDPRREHDVAGRVTEPSPERQATAPVEALDPPTVEPIASVSAESGNPYRPVMVPSDTKSPSTAATRQPQRPVDHDDVTRAFRASVVGLLLLPTFFSLYAVFLLLGIPNSAYRDQQARRTLIASWLISLAAAVIGLFFPFWIGWF